MADAESRSIAKQIKRYAQVGGVVGKLATKLASQKYLGVKLDKEKHALEIREALGGIKGPLMKVAQLSATIPDLLPDEYTKELMHLQSNAPPMGWLFVKRRMATELSSDWLKNFKEFDKEATRAASLGQVHKAVLNNSEKVACKLQYPDMQSAIEADLRQLKLLFQLYERYDSAISTSDIYDELSERLYEELDYRREAQNMQLYRYMLADESCVVVPQHRPELSTERLLTMNWLDGTRLMPFLDTNPDQDTRNKIAKHMFRVWYVPFYYYGVIHGDPHLGNYSIASDHRINLMDFGSIRLFRPEFVAGVIELYKALRDDDNAQAVDAYERWGFVGLDNEAIDVLNMWAGFIYAPLLEDRVRPIQQMRNGKAGRDLAGKVHQELKRIGGIRPPREFVLMDRAAVGLGSVFMHLGAEVNWHELFHDLIDDFSVDGLASRQREAAETIGLPAGLITASA